jgi:hypothetical protein
MVEDEQTMNSHVWPPTEQNSTPTTVEAKQATSPPVIIPTPYTPEQGVITITIPPLQSTTAKLSKQRAVVNSKTPTTKTKVELTEMDVTVTPTLARPIIACPTNNRNSCYIDSLLVALFGSSDVIIDSIFLLPRSAAIDPGSTDTVRTRFRNELCALVEGVRKPYTIKRVQTATKRVAGLRTILDQHRSASRFGSSAPQDSGELLMTMNGLLGADRLLHKYRVVVRGTNDLLSQNHMVVTTDRIEDAGFAHTIPLYAARRCNTTTDMLVDETDVVLDQPYGESAEQTFIRALTRRVFVPTLQSFAIIIDRVSSNGRIDHARVPVDQDVSGRTFHAAVLFKSGHYTCVYLDKQTRRFMLYNDVLPNTPTVIGADWATMCDATRVNEHATILVYN